MDNTKKTICFPFEFVPMMGEKCSFLKNVEGIIQTDLQTENSFGCKINGCHMHAGSKIHFLDFVEAEILFHNNYYNHGFAYLSVEEIRRNIDPKTKHVCLVGYESYSELFLKEVQEQFIQSQSNADKEKIGCDYFIYETLSIEESGYESERKKEKHFIDNSFGRKPEAIIRNLYKKKDGKFSCCYGLSCPLTAELSFEDCLFVYIVPINTSLSTMDKMVSLFERACGLKQEGDDGRKINRQYICLITIGPEESVNNIYWEKTGTSMSNGDELRPKEGKFENLTSNDSIITFAYAESSWTYAKINDTNFQTVCKDCYPDRFNKALSLTDEKPVFDVTRNSVVPMLQLGQKHLLKPISCDPAKKESNEHNLKRVWKISKYTLCHHIYRGNNHFQFYIDAPGFLEAYSNDKDADISVSKYLESIRTQSEDCDNLTIYNYIVAPSHKTNATWVNMVYSKVFSSKSDDYRNEFNGARVLYFDVAKEYRSNFKAKYSDFVQSFSNILRSNDNYEIRFHFVDETITTGSRFLRAADLIQSLLSSIELDDNQKKRIKLFHSIYLLYGRSSVDSKRFYYRLFKEAGLNDFEKLLHQNFHEYANIRISNMRNFKDACTLCKFTNDYRTIRSYCATNTLACKCSEVIHNHEPRKATVLAKENEFSATEQFSNVEKRYMFLITHILNSRICSNNEPLFEGEKAKKEIDIESVNAPLQIKNVLTDYYSNLMEWLSEILKEDFKSELDITAFLKAFIKVISRPFFSFHLRKRQAAFAFCLDQIENLCFNNTNTGKKKVKKADYNSIETIINALADMNANYLIRYERFSKLASIASESSKSALSFCNAIKKMITLSQDTTKSLLLEHVLVYDQEDGFFNGKYPGEHKLNFLNWEEVEVDGKKTKDGSLSLRGLIYLENNRILLDALRDIYRNPKLTEYEGHAPYFLDNFISLLQINSIKLDPEFGVKLKELVDRIVNEKELSGKRIKAVIDTISDPQIVDGNMKIIPFVRNKRISLSKKNYNKSFEFMLFSEDIEYDNKKQFYRDDNLSCLNRMFKDTLDSDKENGLISKDVLFNDDTVVIRFQSNIESDGDDPKSDTDNAVYIEIRDFDYTSVVHWFRLKTILSLRNAISKMIALNNMPATIEKLFNGMLQSAMTDKKAQMHKDIKTTLNLDFCDQDVGVAEDVEESGSGINAALREYNKGVDASRAILQKVYFKCLSLMSDELLASWYRKLIRREKDPEARENRIGANGDLVFFNSDDTDHTVVNRLKQLFNASVIETSDGLKKHSIGEDRYRAGEFDYYCCVGPSFRKVKVFIDFHVAEDTLNKHVVFIDLLETSVSPVLGPIFFPILVLLVNNAVSHADADIVNVIFDIKAKCIRIENSIGKGRVKDISPKKVEECMQIIPFIRKECSNEEEDIEGLTLWTLKHLTKEKNWFKAYFTRDGKKFVVKLNNCINMEER